MFTPMAIALGAAALLLVVAAFYRPSKLPSLIARAHHTGEVEALVAAIAAMPAAKQPTQWDQTIGQLWQAYERETATRLVIEGARRSDAPVLQYWIRRVMEVEPDIAQEMFDEAFLAEHFRPEVARQCGTGCGCG